MPPDAPDIYQRKILSGDMMCFYDGKMRAAPSSWEDYCNAEHISVSFARGHRSSEVLRSADRPEKRTIIVSVPNFSAVPAFVKGSHLIATEVSLMKLGPFKDLEIAPLPFKSDPVPIYMVWHERNHSDPAHIWLRRRIEKIAQEIPLKL